MLRVARERLLATIALPQPSIVTDAGASHKQFALDLAARWLLDGLWVPDKSDGRDVRLGWLFPGLFLLVFAFYALTGPGYSTSLDGSLMLLSARNLLRSGSITVPAVAELTRRGLDGREYPKFGPGLVLAHLPVLFAVGHLEFLRPVVDAHPVSSLDRDAFYASLTNAALMAATVCGIGLCGVALGFSVRSSVLLAALMAVGSPLWLYARTDSSEALQSACLIGASYCLLRERGSLGTASAFAAGIFLAAAIATKALNFIVLPWFVAFAVWRTSSRKSLVAVSLVSPAAVGVALLVAFNWLRFGASLETGYDITPSLFGHPLLDGAYVQLFSAGHGLVLFCPALLLLPLAIGHCARRMPAESVLVAVVFLTFLLAFSKWWAYWGMNWGPRFLVPAVPLVALGLMPLAEPSSHARVPLLALLALGIAVQAVAVTTSYWGQVMPVWMRLAPPPALDRGSDPRMKDIGLWNYLVHRPEVAPLRVGIWWLRNASCQEPAEPAPKLSAPPWATEHPWIDPQHDTELLGELRGLDLWAVPECLRLRYAPLWAPQTRRPIPASPRLFWILLGIGGLGLGLVSRALSTTKLQPRSPIL